MDISNTLIIYEFREYCSTTIFSTMEQISPLSICFVFISGSLTAFSPCTISSIPFTLNYLNTSNNHPTGHKSSYIITSIIGLMTSMLCFSIMAILFNSQVFMVSHHFTFLIPILMIGFGLYTLDYFKNIIPSLAETILPNNLRTISQQGYWVGFVLGVTTISCNIPIIISITLYIAVASNWFTGLLFLCIYGLGYLVPFIVFILLLKQINKFFITIQRLNYTNYIMGCIILSSGTFSLIQQL